MPAAFTARNLLAVREEGVSVKPRKLVAPLLELESTYALVATSWSAVGLATFVILLEPISTVCPLLIVRPLREPNVVILGCSPVPNGPIILPSPL